jgi:hypothetical protein
MAAIPMTWQTSGPAPAGPDLWPQASWHTHHPDPMPNDCSRVFAAAMTTLVAAPGSGQGKRVVYGG